jgi:RHS repeat-associated protein
MAAEDVNGNQITYSASSITDTLGRNIPQPPKYTGQASTTTTEGCTGPLQVTYAYAWNPPGLSGNALSYKLCYATVAISIPTSPDGTIIGRTASAVLLQSVVLPNNQAWTFEYSDRDPADPATVNYGNLTKITLPTGGTIVYTYMTNSGGVDLGSRWVTSRSVDAQDGNGPHTWQYSYAFSGTTWTNTLTTIVGNPPGSAGSPSDETVHTAVTPGVTGCGNNNFYETQTQYFSGSHANGTLLKTVTTDYQSSCPFSLPVRVTTAWANGQTTKTETAYDPQFAVNEHVQGPATANYGVATSTSDFDYGAGAPGPLLRTTTTSYLWQGNANYLNNNFLHLLGSITVSDGGGTQVAQTSFGYDEYALNGSGISTQHDPSPANGSIRGNQTSARHWLNGSTVSTSNCPVAVSNDNVVSYATYNDTGTVNQTTDTCGTAAGDPNHTTTFAYSPTFAGAYPTSVTNALSQTANANYDFTTGLELSRTDANNQTTTFSYDTLRRPTQINTPDGGQATSCYTDLGGATCAQAPPPFKVVVTKKINASQNLVSTVVIDGLGHKTETQLNSDPACPSGIKVDTTYDSQGRVASVTNPFCTTGDATYGVTRYAYDALSRTTQVTHPDGSTATTTYSGRAVQVTDEGNGTRSVQHIAQSDALGRLQNVCEVSGTTLSFGSGATPAACGLDIAGTGFLTTYTYDVLGNLTAASQGGFLPRSFQYDSLSQLTSASNPESGTISYAYDAIGNMVSKTDARNITTTYSYDKLSRLTGKSYNDNITPAAAFVYDVCPAGGCPTGVSPQLTVGRMVEAYTANAKTFYSYDPMGRAANQWECTPVNCGTNSFYGLVYGYDFAGNLTSENNGFGITLTSAYDSASRLTGVTSSLSDANHPANLLSGIQYNGLGLPSLETLGNGASETLGYDTRMRLANLTVTSPTAVGATPGTGSVTLSGTEQSRAGAPATPGIGTVVISGKERKTLGNPDCVPPHCVWIYDTGTVTITVNGTNYQVSYGQNSTTSTLAQALVNLLNAGSLVNATFTVSSTSPFPATITLTAQQPGAASNYSLSANSATSDPNDFTNSFTATASGTSLTGGQDTGPTTYDSGTVSITVNNGTPCSATYGQNTTAASLATALASAVTGCSSLVNASASGTTVNLTAKSGGGNTTYTLAVSSTSSNGFSPPSFSGTASGGTLTGGTGASAGTIYSLALGYASNSNVLTANDSVNGNWTYGYDDFNRLTSSNKNNGQQTYSYQYDRFGNRWQQNAPQGGSVFVATFTAGNNRMDGASYDAAGNMTHDPTTGANYSYDAENRIISVNNGAVTYTYDAGGQRVEKNVGGVKTDYVYDLGGRAIAEVNGSGTVTREEVFAGGKHLATYANNTTYFNHGDRLGTERARSDMTGAACETIQSLPFGDGQSSSGGCGDPSTRHFTGKERDLESGLDYFGARYYASSLGRFVTPDWAAGPATVPYAFVGDPQSLNLYSYVRNRPTVMADPDGHLLINGVESSLNMNDRTASMMGGNPTNGGMEAEGLLLFSAGMQDQALAEAAAKRRQQKQAAAQPAGVLTRNVLDLSLGLAPPPTLAVPTLSITTVSGGPGSGQLGWLTIFNLDIPSDPRKGGSIIQQLIPSSAAEKTFWEAWFVPPGKQYTDVALANGKADDQWTNPGRSAVARYYDGLDLDDLKRIGFEIGNVPWAIGRPSTFDDPSSQLQQQFPSVRGSNVVTRSFPY